MTGAAWGRTMRHDLRVLWHLLFHPVRGANHAERMENFYQAQAGHYDSFRARLLHGREELISAISFPHDGVWIDLGAGTGENWNFAGRRADALREVHLVDLSPSLLKVAAARVEDRAAGNVQLHVADVNDFVVASDSVDVVTFSYSMTMIPDWFDALALAERVLKPGGIIAVVDFYVSRKYVPEDQNRHGWLTRTFWREWFAADNVFLSGDHIAALHRHFEPVRFEQRRGKVPYMPLLRAPYYVFLGRKRAS